MTTTTQMCQTQSKTSIKNLNSYYSIHEIKNVDSDRDDDFRKRINAFDSDEELEEFIVGVWSGRITPTNLDNGLYFRTAELLEKAYSSVPNSAFTSFSVELRQSLWLFSAAKNFRQTVDMNLLLTDDNGIIKQFSVFKKDVSGLMENFNKNYLRTEYNMAVASTQSSVAWEGIQQTKDLFPSLRYITAGDERVREDHVELNNIIRPVDDDFWSTYFPPNDWGCRCDAVQVNTRTKTNLRDRTLHPPLPMFNNNPGKSRKIFTQNHPYFSVPEELKGFRSNNFGLPLPTELFDNG